MAIALRQDTTSSSFSEATSAGSLLVLVCTAFTTNTTNADTITFTVTTSGFSWTLAEEDSYQYITGSDPTTKYDTGTSAIYYIENASSMADTVTTSVTASFGGSIVAQMYEFTGAAATSVKDSSSGSNNSSAVNETVTADTIDISSGDLVICVSTHPTTIGSGFTAGATETVQYVLGTGSGTLSCAWGAEYSLWAASAVSFKVVPATVVTPSGVSATFSIDNPTIKAGATVAPAAVTATFSLGTVYVPQPGVAYPGQVSATFALGPIVVGNPVNYGNIVSGSASIPGGINSTYFYVRWVGYLSVDISGIYTLGLNVQDGGDLFIGTQPIVSVLSASQTANSAAAYTNSGTIELRKNVNYPIVCEWAHGSGADYQIQLLWTPPGSTSPSVIPVTNLELTGYWWNTSSGSPYPQGWY